METIATVRSWLKDEGVSSNRIKLSASLDWIEFSATVERRSVCLWPGKSTEVLP